MVRNGYYFQLSKFIVQAFTQVEGLYFIATKDICLVSTKIGMLRKSEIYYITFKPYNMSQFHNFLCENMFSVLGIKSVVIFFCFMYIPKVI